MISTAGSSTSAEAKGISSAISEIGIDIEDINLTEFPTVQISLRVLGGLESILANGGSFNIAEDGQARPATSTRFLSSEGLNVILVIDRSGSMAGKPINATKKAAVGFITSLPPEVSIGLVSFGSDVTLDVELTRDRSRLMDAVSTIRADGRTALNDAVVFASTLFAPTSERRVMIVLSDGGDSTSSAPLDKAIDATSGIRMEIIELITSESNHDSLVRLAAPQLVRATPNPTELDELYASISESLVGRVEITYMSNARDGEHVELTVRLVDINQTRQAKKSFSAPALSVSPTLKDANPDSVPSASRNTQSSKNFFAWGLPISILIIFAGLLLLLISLFVTPDRSLRQRLFPINPSVVNHSATQKVATAIDRRLQNLDAYKRLVAKIETSAIERKAPVLVLNTLMVTAASVIASYALMNLPGALIAMFVIPFGSLKLLKRKIRRRRAEFIAQLPDTLQMMSSMLRSGYGLVQALDTVANEADEPTHSLLGQVMLEVRTGRDLIESLRALAAQIDSLDVDWVVAGIEISHEVGSDLATTLDTVSDTVRERENLRGQISALTAEGRLSAYVMLALPPIVGVMSFVVNPDFARVLFEGIGFLLLAFTGFLMLIGFTWMRSIIAKVS